MSTAILLSPSPGRGGELLVLVIVVLAQLGLANALGRRVAKHVRQQADFQSPVRRDAIAADQMRSSETPRQR